MQSEEIYLGGDIMSILAAIQAGIPDTVSFLRKAGGGAELKRLSEFMIARDCQLAYI